MIKSLNNRILSEEKTQDQPKCNCRQKDSCPLEGHCLDKELIYWCILKENTTSDAVKYNGLTENTFKDWFYKHCNSFKYESKANSTELSKHFWEIKRKGIKKPIMHCSVIGQVLSERVEKVQLMFNRKVPYFKITGQSH